MYKRARALQFFGNLGRAVCKILLYSLRAKGFADLAGGVRWDLCSVHANAAAGDILGPAGHCRYSRAQGDGAMSL